MVEGHGTTPKFSLYQCEFHMIKPSAAHAFGKIAGIKPQTQCLFLDLAGYFCGHFACALDQGFMRVDLFFYKGSDRAGDHFLLFGQSILHFVIL